MILPTVRAAVTYLAVFASSAFATSSFSLVPSRRADTVGLKRSACIEDLTPKENVDLHYALGKSFLLAYVRSTTNLTRLSQRHTTLPPRL